MEESENDSERRKREWDPIGEMTKEEIKVEQQQNNKPHWVGEKKVQTERGGRWEEK